MTQTILVTVVCCNLCKDILQTKADIEILEITDVPMFNETDDQTDTPVIQKFNQAISEADV